MVRAMTLWVVGTVEIGQVGEGRGNGLSKHDGWQRLYGLKSENDRIRRRWNSRKRGRPLGLGIGLSFMNC